MFPRLDCLIPHTEIMACMPGCWPWAHQLIKGYQVIALTFDSKLFLPSAHQLARPCALGYCPRFPFNLRTKTATTHNNVALHRGCGPLIIRFSFFNYHQVCHCYTSCLKWLHPEMDHLHGKPGFLPQKGPRGSGGDYGGVLSKFFAACARNRWFSEVPYRVVDAKEFSRCERFLKLLGPLPSAGRGSDDMGRMGCHMA